MWRFIARGLFIALILVSSVSAETAPLAADRWTVQSVAGDVSVAAVPVSGWRVPEAGQTLDAPFSVRTGATGQMMLVRGEDSLLVSPQSRIEIRPVEHSADAGLLTRILQTLGSLVYQVEKRPQQRFEVQTPYLVSVVKGTTFTVSITEHDTAVSLEEGSLEVSSRDSAHRVLLKPGEIARQTRGIDGIRVSDGALRQSQWGAWHPANAGPKQNSDRRTPPDIARWQDAPGQAGVAPGQAGSAPGLAGTAPGLAGTAPGLSGTAPGPLGGDPGRSGTAPGRNK